MSLVNLSNAFTRAHLRAQTSEDQLRDLQEWLAMWFLDGNLGAQEFLVSVAQMWREENQQ